MARPDGKEIWRVDFAGTGAVHPDGSISMLVGSNESPAWDNWEYRRLSPAGKVQATLPARIEQKRPQSRSKQSQVFAATNVGKRGRKAV